MANASDRHALIVVCMASIILMILPASVHGGSYHKDLSHGLMDNDLETASKGIVSDRDIIINQQSSSESESGSLMSNSGSDGSSHNRSASSSSGDSGGGSKAGGGKKDSSKHGDGDPEDDIVNIAEPEEAVSISVGVVTASSGAASSLLVSSVVSQSTAAATYSPTLASSTSPASAAATPFYDLGSMFLVDYGQHMLMLSLTNVPMADGLRSITFSMSWMTGLVPIQGLNSLADYIRNTASSAKATVKDAPASLIALCRYLQIEVKNLFLVTLIVFGFSLMTVNAVCLLIIVGQTIVSPFWKPISVRDGRNAVIALGIRTQLRLVIWLFQVLALASIFHLTFVDEEEGATIQGSAAILLIGISFVFMIYVFAVIRKHSESLDLDRVRSKYGPLYSEYADGNRYFLLVRLASKLIDAVAIGLLFGNPLAQITVLILGRSVYGIIFWIRCPLETVFLNRVNHMVNLAKVISAAVLLGFIPEISSQLTTTAYILGVVHVLVFLIFFTARAITTIHAFKYRRLSAPRKRVITSTCGGDSTIMMAV